MTLPLRPPTPLPLLAGAVVLVALLAAGLTRCRTPHAPAPADPESQGGDLRGTLFLAIGIDAGQTLTAAMLQEQRRQGDALVQAFRPLHPGVRIRVSEYREEQLERELE